MLRTCLTTSFTTCRTTPRVTTTESRAVFGLAAAAAPGSGLAPAPCAAPGPPVAAPGPPVAALAVPFFGFFEQLAAGEVAPCAVPFAACQGQMEVSQILNSEPWMLSFVQRS